MGEDGHTEYDRSVIENNRRIAVNADTDEYDGVFVVEAFRFIF